MTREPAWPGAPAAAGGFDARAPIESARTPPGSWYHDPAVLARERLAVFRRRWLAAARAADVAAPRAYAAAELAGTPVIVLRDEEGRLRAFHGACRHHGALLLEGRGSAERVTCPYHGWSYALDGRLVKAPRAGGAAGLERVALAPLAVEALGPLVLVHAGTPAESAAEALGPPLARLAESGWERLAFVARRTWELRCNWKVYVENYLDGGYHVPGLHRNLASRLDVASYRVETFALSSLQSCAGAADPDERVGARALYAFLHPNLMINRYGPWLDVDVAWPLDAERTLVVMDYWVEPERAADRSFVERSLAASDEVQREDLAVCERVQRGLRSPAYDEGGRYAPRVETALHHFHRLLAADLAGA